MPSIFENIFGETLSGIDKDRIRKEAFERGFKFAQRHAAEITEEANRPDLGRRIRLMELQRKPSPAK